jgi:hypothetical protein
MEIKGKILAKKGDNKAFKLDDGNWYNLNDNVIPYLEKMSKGDEVIVTFEKKGVSRYVSKLSVAGAAEAPRTETTSTTGYVCEVCGKALKDGTFKKCFMCNKTGATKKEEVKPSTEPYVKKEYKSYESKSYYGSPEDVAGKEMGCALGAAATVASSQQFNDPEVAKQFTLILADEFLTWMRAQK